MGLEIVVDAAGALPALLRALAADGFPCQLMMIDGALQPPSAQPPPAWREVRLRTPAGMVTLERRGAAVALKVFGNADPALLAAQRKIADALGAG